MPVSHIRGRRRAAVRDRGAYRSCGPARRSGLGQALPAGSDRAARSRRPRSPAALASVSSRNRAQVLHQRRAARAGRDHSRSRRFRASREKDAARILVRNALRAVDFGDASAWCASISFRSGSKTWTKSFPNPRPDPDSEGRTRGAGRRSRPADRRSQERYGITRPIWLMPILESALGIENASAIATASEQTVAPHHRARRLHRRPGRGEDAAGTRVAVRAHAPGECGTGCRSAGHRFGFRRRRRHGRPAALGRSSRALGFEGMGCIHPGQIPVIHEAFAPSRARSRRR